MSDDSWCVVQRVDGSGMGGSGLTGNVLARAEKFSAPGCRDNARPDIHTHAHTHAHTRTRTAAGLSLELFSPQDHLPAAAAHHQAGAQRNEFKMAEENTALLVESPGW
jgi:hypothetical protein